jgi:malonyl-CoA O-methyltransferase
MSVLAARDGYRLWAPTYASETAVSALENDVVEALGVPTAGRRLLDVGCGVGRRLATSGAALAIGVDLSPEMLAAGGHGHLIAADMRALPLADASFDVVWCRLAIGHARDLERSYAELARVSAHGGAVIVSDFHPAAAARGLRRTFRDASGAVHEIEHFRHEPIEHERAARAHGLKRIAMREGVVGADIRQFYERAKRLDVYEQQLGQPVVLALVFTCRR